ncbi:MULTISPECIES: tRNA-intron lyase [unclassified Haloferax]|uniref:tRNA-intron lyase n=1 Tax=Haloferax TaxID=2251 RepID=UPI0002B01C0C|nr:MULTISPECIES: tRNA-intron lyase [unclassified Haloferax]ELZ57387.1 tRNA splicing endonuclease [Haloferax sp. ATCC BAA-646]ELZ62351.1 tRNA splicing endonuclease [Haloferax sp. ATCC BAA-645]ELZ65392.1 tRNA splicing endonuclease [Haloferax sp. ATCC BAA-644]
MQGRLEDGVVHLPGDARQRFHDSRGYGRPTGGDDLEVAPVEAAHLLSRDDIDGVDGMGLRELLARTGTTLDFVVYKDLRDRGFYLSPAREGWPGVDDAAGADFLVYPRGKGPWDGEVEYRVRVVGERESIPVSSLGDVVLAIVDEDGDLTYFDTEGDSPEGTAAEDLPADLDAELLSDRALVWDGVDRLYQRGFFGQRLYGRNADSGPLQLSLLEAAYLARADALAIDESDVVSRGRDVEGDRFDRRLAVYAALREAATVPKSGFKFGSDFRVYTEFESVSDLSHSESLVRVVAPGHTFVPRDLSLDVRLAGGVRKRMVFALTDDNGEIDWLSVSRLTP